MSHFLSKKCRTSLPGLFLLPVLLLSACITTERTDPAVESLLQHGRYEGNEDFFRNLVKQHLDKVNQVADGYYVETPLQVAAFAGQAQKVKALLEAGAQPDLRQEGRYTPLMFAAWQGHTEVVRLLLEAGARPDAVVGEKGGSRPPTPYVLKEDEWPLEDESTEGMTALHFAAGRGHADIVRLLCKAGAPLDTMPEKQSIRISPLGLAVGAGSMKCVKALLEAGANPNVATEEFSPLQRAVAIGNTEMVRLLLAAGASPNAVAGEWPPLHVAVHLPSVKIVRLLLAAGADANAVDPGFGGNALHHARILGDREMEKLLRKAGASADWPADCNKLLGLASCEENQAVMQELLARVESVNAPVGKMEYTPLMYAAAGGYGEMVRLLLARGAEVNAESSRGDTALHMAARRGHAEVVRLLLAAGAEVDADDAPDGFTPLLYAAMSGRAEVVRLLLAAGADKEAELDREGQTPLWLAALNNHPDVIRELLQAGADFRHACTWQNSTPLVVAAHQGKLEAVKALLEGGADANLLHPATHYRGDPLQSALSAACDSGSGTAAKAQHVEIVKLLLEAGANPVLPPERTDVERQPVYGAMVAAYPNGDTRLLRMLLKAGGCRGIEDALRARIEELRRILNRDEPATLMVLKHLNSQSE